MGVPSAVDSLTSAAVLRSPSPSFRASLRCVQAVGIERMQRGGHAAVVDRRDAVVAVRARLAVSTIASASVCVSVHCGLWLRVGVQVDRAWR